MLHYAVASNCKNHFLSGLPGLLVKR